MGGVYIHVPFCRSRCAYCDFYSTTLGEEWHRAYVLALCREIRFRSVSKPFTRVHSIYIGGGTPSLLSQDMLAEIFRTIGECMEIDGGAEVTIEANPDDVTAEWLQGISFTPANRISIGVQTFSDDILTFLGRRHTAEQAVNAVAMCRAAGYDNISIDLIYGLPGQTMSLWHRDVGLALGLDVPHLSAYSLSYEEGTRLSLMLQSHEVEEVADEVSWEMYEYLMDEVDRAGMSHYEISNFCKPGMHSRHNSSYWTGKPYFGFGPGAHSYDGGRIRRANDSDVRAYVMASGDVGHSIETLSDNELYDEMIMTRLRTKAGLSLDALNPADREYCLRMSVPHIEAGRMTLSNGILRLAREGIFVSNDIICDIMRGV